jgi:ketosteroid isomerase-like protein
MPRILLVAAVAVVAVVGLLVFSPANAQTQSAVERELIKLGHDWETAADKKDRATLEKLLGDDFIGTSADGVIRTKSQEIADGMQDTDVTLSSSTTEFKARVYGDVAVVTYRFAWKAMVDGKEKTSEGRATDVWVKRGGRWQCIGYHNSRIAKK